MVLMLRKDLIQARMVSAWLYMQGWCELLTLPPLEYSSHTCKSLHVTRSSLNMTTKQKEAVAELGWGMPTQPSAGRGRWISEFVSSLVYTVSPRRAMATQKNPFSNKEAAETETKQKHV